MTPSKPARTSSSRTTHSQASPDLAQERPNQSILLIALIVAVCVCVGVGHRGVLSAKAKSMNDGTYVTQNYRVQNPSVEHAWLFLAEVSKPSTVEGYYQPLAMISLMLDTAIWDADAEHLERYHRTSLLLHLGNTALVIVLVYLLFGQVWPAALTGLLFGMHPLTVETIAWLGERKTPLATFFALGTIVLYVLYTRRQNWLIYGATMATFLLALMSKPTVTPVPVLLLLLDGWPLQRLGRRAILEKLPLLALAGVFAIITVVSQQHLDIPKAQTVTFVQTGLLACHNLLFYPLKVIWPANLSTVYPFPKPIGPSNLMVLGGLAVTITSIPLLWLARRRVPAVVVGCLFFVLALGPTFLNVGYAFTVAADKYLYLPMIGLFLIVAWAICQGWTNAPPERLALQRGGVLISVAILATSYGVATHRYLKHWRDTGSYCEHILTIASETWWAHNQYSVYLLAKGETEQALEHAEQATECDPSQPQAWTNLGLALIEPGKDEQPPKPDDITKAVTAFTRALKIKADLAQAHHGLGKAYGHQGNWKHAIAQHETALESMPHSPIILFYLGTAYMHTQQFDRAYACLEEVRKQRPDSVRVIDRLAEAHFLNGTSLAESRQFAEAIPCFEKAVSLRPNAIVALHSLAYAYAELGRTGEAIRAYRAVLKLAPDHEQATAQLAALLNPPSRSTQPE